MALQRVDLESAFSYLEEIYKTEAAIVREVFGAAPFPILLNAS